LIVKNTIVGIISDTHGLLRPQALAALAGSDLIIHAGDVGDRAVIDALRKVAPTFAVRGNIDTGPLAAELPATEMVDIGGPLAFVLHNVADLDFAPADAGFAAVIFGHSHQPLIETRDGVLFLNPGSAGPRRFKLPVCVARITVTGAQIRPEILDLQV
jgi:putative phosphoesterase